MYFPLTAIDREIGALFPGRSYANGGRVRDFFRDRFHGTRTASKDLDYVLTGTTVAEAADRLRSLGAVTLAGASFPIFKVATPAGILDVALARKERSTGTGHRDFEVDFGVEVSLEADQQRRDFTMNMLSVDLSTGTVIAPAQALEDIQNGVIRAPSENTILEDPLRMLRAVQFASRLCFTIAPQTLAWMQKHRALIATTSAERQAEELVKLLTRSVRPSVGLRLLAELEALGFVLPELTEGIGCVQNHFHRYDVFGHNLAATDAAAATDGDLVDLLAALLHDVGKPRTAAPRADGQGQTFHGHEVVGASMARAILGRLRFSHDVASDVSSLVASHMYAVAGSDGGQLSDAAVRRFIRTVSRETDDRALARMRVERQFALRHCDRAGSGRPLSERQRENAAFEARVRAEMAKNPPLSPAALAIDGTDVIAAAVACGARKPGFRGDRIVGETLRSLLELVTEDPHLNERSRLLEATRDLLTVEA
jgi:tRNA nucleotidyltransferase (CCA-adding enzyme)